MLRIIKIIFLRDVNTAYSLLKAKGFCLAYNFQLDSQNSIATYYVCYNGRLVENIFFTYVDNNNFIGVIKLIQ